ncbi:CcoQ/FixQ family Cbb3-type cytochrome c oxidase assembly chaperone [Gilvimarinus chinensis]|uniref:CcoQ/FixQ family Cbb3-type cytochrome c oxidase assembly chaperone n=1 Tax=Gilvimarinus chinensis TaxID=396005 RepID=UPI00035F456E|nr:CcoQ/FixQ family Cbb3-type cytochrome c oxidase assembly chaperone [Gilvimarinus chinensis]
MDKGTLGAISTVLVAVAFAAVCWWAFAPKRKKRFEEDANLPFADEQNGQKQQAEKDTPSTDDVARRN